MDGFYWNLQFLVLIVIAKRMVTSQEHARSQCPNGCYVGVNSNRHFDAYSSDGSRLDNSLTCFSVNTTLYYFCKNVYSEQIDPNNYYRNCTPSGWVNIQNYIAFPDNTPTCRKRRPDCYSPNATEGILIEIDGRNIPAEGESTKPLFYLDGTKAVYRCIDPHKKIKIRKNNGSDITESFIYKKCSKGLKKWTYLNDKYSEEAELTCVTSNDESIAENFLFENNSTDIFVNPLTLQRNMLLVVCCLLSTTQLVSLLILFRIRNLMIAARRSTRKRKVNPINAISFNNTCTQKKEIFTVTEPRQDKSEYLIPMDCKKEEIVIYEEIDLLKNPSNHLSFGSGRTN